jgi:hypothetical protein
VWESLASIIRSVGDSLGFVYNAASDAYDALAGGVEWALEKIISLHNSLNDLPKADEIPGIAEEDIEMPDLSGAPGGSDSAGEESGGGDGFTPSPPSAAATSVTGAAVASLPGTDPTASSTGGAGTASAASSASGSGPALSSSPAAGTGTTVSGGTTIENNITVEGGMPRSDARLNRMIRRMHQKLNKRQAKMSGPGTA